MANEINQFLDFKKWLQDNLDALVPDYFKVSNERSIDAGDFEGEVVISALSGIPYEDSANIPYQIDVFTADSDKVMNILNTLCKTVSNVPFTQVIQTGKQMNDNQEVPVYANHRITPYLNTPVIMDKNVEVGSNVFNRIVIFASMLVFYDVNDITSLIIDGETINTLDSALAYTAEMQSNRISGQEMNKSKKKASTVGITFTSINKGGVFGNKVFRIATGQLSGNTAFNVQVTLTNGLTATLKMIVGSSSLGHSRGKLPSLNVSMYLYDDRGDNHA